MKEGRPAPLSATPSRCPGEAGSSEAQRILAALERGKAVLGRIESVHTIGKQDASSKFLYRVTFRFEADNKPGATARLTGLIADAGINIRGLSVAVIGTRFVAYIGFDSTNDAEAVVSIFQDAGAEVI